MRAIKTYQDLLDIGENEKERMEFVRGAVRDHTSSDDYKIAAAAEAYYAKQDRKSTRLNSSH